MRIWKCKNFFVKSYIPNWSSQTFVIKNLKNALLWTYAIEDFKSKNCSESLKKRMQKKYQTQCRNKKTNWQGTSLKSCKTKNERCIDVWYV